MLRSLQQAELAMRVQQARIETLANNLANVDATGFKQILNRVTQGPVPTSTPAWAASGGEDAGAAGGGAPSDAGAPGETATGGLTGLAPAYGRGETAPAGALPAPASAGPRAGGQLPPADDLRIRTLLDPRPGHLRQTGRATDVAVRGEGFFVVRRGDRDLYTRAGAFQIDEQRRLVDGAGNQVQGGGGALQVEGQNLQIRSDGALVVDGAEVGRLRLVRFADPTRLQHRGGGLLEPPPDMPPEEVPAEQADLAQGHLEGSNVDPIGTLVAMIAAQRAFEIQSKVIQTEDGTLDRSVNELGRAR